MANADSSANSSGAAKSSSKNQNAGANKPQKPALRSRLFIGNIPSSLTEGEFRAIFEPFGTLVECFLNSAKGFAFVRYLTREQAEKAKTDLDGYVPRKGQKQFRIRYATHSAALKLTNVPEHVSNELLEDAMSRFGEVERAVVIVDDKGKTTGSAIVEFARKSAATRAMQEINEGVFLLTAEIKPIMGEQYTQMDEEDGLPEKWVNTAHKDFEKARSLPPRMADVNSFEYDFGQKWRKLLDWEKTQRQKLDEQMAEFKEQLMQEQDGALYEYQTHLLREELRQKEEQLRRMEEQSQRRRVPGSMGGPSMAPFNAGGNSGGSHYAGSRGPPPSVPTSLPAFTAAAFPHKSNAAAADFNDGSAALFGGPGQDDTDRRVQGFKRPDDGMYGGGAGMGRGRGAPRGGFAPFVPTDKKPRHL